MSEAPVIAAVSHLGLRVRDLDAALDLATEVLGMRTVTEAGEWTGATCGDAHHSLRYAPGETDAVDHIGLAANGPAALEEVRSRLRRVGAPILSEEPSGTGFAEAISFRAPRSGRRARLETCTREVGRTPFTIRTCARFGHCVPCYP